MTAYINSNLPPNTRQCRSAPSGRRYRCADGDGTPHAIPVLSLLLTLPALLAWLWPGLWNLMVLTREGVGGGEYWRLATGHWVHLGTSHFFWDTLMFLILSVWLERRLGWAVLGLVLISVMGVSGAVWFGRGDLSYYGGLSGIDSALFTCVGLEMLFASKGRGMGGFLSVVVLWLFLLKLVYEFVSGSVLFVDTGGELGRRAGSAFCGIGFGGIVVWAAIGQTGVWITDGAG